MRNVRSAERSFTLRRPDACSRRKPSGEALEGAGVWWLWVSGKEEQRKLLLPSQPRDRDQALGQARGSGTSSCLLLPAPSTLPSCLLPGCCPALGHSPAPDCHTHHGCRGVTASPAAVTARRRWKEGHQAVSMWAADYFPLL